MIQFAYMAAILFSSFGMAVLDRKYRLAFFYDWKRTAIVLAIGLITFSLWDMIGIKLGIFFSGNSPYMSGWYVLPDFPVEEVLFLLFLCYFTLVIYRMGEKAWLRT